MGGQEPEVDTEESVLAIEACRRTMMTSAERHKQSQDRMNTGLSVEDWHCDSTLFN